MEERRAGSFRSRMQDMSSMSISDFNNPWNFFPLMMAGDDVLYGWLRQQRLLPETLACNAKDCGGTMTLKVFSRAPGGLIFRCDRNRSHQQAARANSFFEKSNLTVQDILLFCKSYLDRLSLYQCAQFSGMSYGSTSVNWASMIREMFKEYFQRVIRSRQLSGVIEIDESLFGRRVKHNRGNPNKGLKVWIFGLVERDTNRLILYPVADRSEETLIPIIRRHVRPGSTIYSDGWASYCCLNEIGFDHFTVLHKYSFKKTYTNVSTNEKVEVHTNRIEGAWKHAKDHFKRISGTKLGMFEGHLAEIMWRADVKSNVYDGFFDLVKTLYPLDRPVDFTYTTPLFDSWALQPTAPETDSPADWMIQPGNTDAESESESERSSVTTSVTNPSKSSSSSASASGTRDSFHRVFPPQKTVQKSRRRKPEVREMEDLARLVSASSLDDDDNDDDANKTLTEAPQPAPVVREKSKDRVDALTKDRVDAPTQATVVEPQPSTSGSTSRGRTRSKKERVCHPTGYREASTSTDSDFEPRVLRKRQKPTSSASNPYGKSAYVWSDDDDFM